MDRNSIIGIFFILLIVLVFGYFNSPKNTPNKKQEQQKEIKKTEKEDTNTQNQDASKYSSHGVDSMQVSQNKGDSIFLQNENVKEEKINLENNFLKITFSTKGGKISKVQLKNYKRYDKSPLILFDEKYNNFGLNFISDSYPINTDKLQFVPIKEANKIKMRLYGQNQNQYIEYVYSVKNDSYKVNFEVNFVGMDKIISQNTSFIDLKWHIKAPQQEKGHTFEDMNTGIYYKYNDDEVGYLTETSKEEEEELKTSVKWVAFKQQFFTSFLIADDKFLDGQVKQKAEAEQTKYIKDFATSLSIPYNASPKQNVKLAFYFIPNKYDLLKKQELGLEKVVPLGWGIFGWVNKFLVIPIFNFLGSFLESFGLIILLLTIIIKLILYPLTYKSYLSSAKMRLLKPEIDEINKKIPKEKTVERQQASMKLYKSAGVNPLGGCLPMLIQLPILIAMFRFFPSSIELRQQPFLWADDLSTYDSIAQLGFSIPFYGSHVSLFTILMTISTIIYTVMNNKQMMSTAQMPGMKFMTYLFPVMMLFWFNSYAAALSYYYFLTNMISFGQTFIMKKLVNEKALHHKIKENRKKPIKKSSFQERLEKMAKQRGINPKK